MIETGKVVGKFTDKIVSLLDLNIEVGAEIFLSPSTIEHIKSKHTEFAEDLYKIIAEIIANPDYIGYNRQKNSVDFITDEKIRLCVPVRPSSDGIYFVRSLFMLHKGYFERLKRKGAIFRIDKTENL